MDGQQRSFDQRPPIPATGQRANAGHVEVGGLEEQQGHQGDELRAGEPPPEPSPATGLVRRVDQRPGHQVGVLVRAIGVGMVPVVFVHPPAETESDEQIGHDQSDHVVAPPSTADLAVAGIVADEAQLGEDEGQDGGHEQDPPRVPHPHGGDHHRAQGHDRGGDLDGVVPGAPGQQAIVPHPAGQLGEILAARGGKQGGLEPGVHERLSVGARRADAARPAGDRLSRKGRSGLHPPLHGSGRSEGPSVEREAMDLATAHPHRG